MEVVGGVGEGGTTDGARKKSDWEGGFFLRGGEGRLRLGGGGMRKEYHGNPRGDAKGSTSPARRRKDPAEVDRTSVCEVSKRVLKATTGGRGENLASANWETAEGHADPSVQGKKGRGTASIQHNHYGFNGTPQPSWGGKSFWTRKLEMKVRASKGEKRGKNAFPRKTPAWSR